MLGGMALALHMPHFLPVLAGCPCTHSWVLALLHGSLLDCEFHESEVLLLTAMNHGTIVVSSHGRHLLDKITYLNPVCSIKVLVPGTLNFL